MSNVDVKPGSGNGLRYNANKPDLSLVPVSLFQHMNKVALKKHEALGLTFFFEIQTRNIPEAKKTAVDFFAALPLEAFVAMVSVLQYGKTKYYAWNWTNGMSWSSVLASGLRHYMFGLFQGDETDKESGLPHIGHIACNVLFLLTYIDTYPEGNDMPPLNAVHKHNGLPDNNAV